MKDTKHPFVPNILNLCIKIKIYFRFTNRSLFSAVPHVNIRCAFLSGSLKLNKLLYSLIVCVLRCITPGSYLAIINN